MAITIVQTAKVQPAAVGTTISFTLSSSPTVGNVLVAFTGYSQYPAGGKTCSAPDGTWTKVDDATQGYASLATWVKVVQGGDGTTYTFTINNTEWHSGVIYEVSGVDTTTSVNQHSIVTGTSSTDIQTTPVTPSVIGTLALAAANTDSGTNGSVSISSLTAGWTLDQSARPDYHATFGCHKDDLTTDTTTSISVTFNFTNNSNGELAAIVLLNPASSGGIGFFIGVSP